MDLDNTKKTRLQLAVALAVAVTLIIALPLLVMLAKSMALAVGCAVLGLAAINFAPVLGMKFANWKLKAIRAEATANPIETMESEYLSQMKLLGDQRVAIEHYEAAVNNYVKVAKAAVAKYPARADEFLPEVAGRVALLEMRWEAWSAFNEELQAFREKINEEAVVNEAALALLAVDNLTPRAEKQALSQIKLSAATNAVRNNVSASSARLSAQLRELSYDPAKQLEIKSDAAARAKVMLGITKD